MFDKLRKTIRERRLNKEILAFDNEKYDNKISLYGKWQDGKRVYNNGCYFVPDEVKIGSIRMGTLYSKGGKNLGTYDMMNVVDWHHGFVSARYHYSTTETYYDCDGNAIFDCVGVFISNEKEFGPDLYLVPIGGCSKYILYNHKTRSFVSDSDCKGCYIVFDGVKPQGDTIIATVDDLSEDEGYGTLSNSTHYRMVFTINRSGKIIDTKKEITKTTHGE